MMTDTIHMHPWFRLPTLKRKSTYVFDDAESHRTYSHSSNPLSNHPLTEEPFVPSKRRRCDVLERGLAQLSIAVPSHEHTGNLAMDTMLAWSAGGQVPISAPDRDPVSVDWYPIVTEPEDIPIECDREESWFEPEKDRIVITRLDDADEGDLKFLASSPTPGDIDSVSVSISPALLDRLKSHHQTFGIPGLLQGPSTSHSPPSTDNSKAVILFKPLHIPPQPTIRYTEEEEDVETPRNANLSEDADLMDVEML